ncbi:ABC transporter ATP-binding protein [Dongia rigui]|uniref:ABC transporter ATP-binding protein n=1 Tax=Dongia rigui TaxID=940149 RepID=A0ABU5E1E8_9PROT|nr:ABC transporter ATP-binding protein [Dongia rigui]MDY0873413.1 ABC transporter ATP-binding protein [Dongia rigui]
MAVELENVGLTVRGAVHIHPTSLRLERGTINVLLGATLSGKTTLMRLLAGLDQPSAGRVSYDGRDMTRVPVRKRNVAMVYQQFINYPALSVYENIASPLRVQGVPKAEIEAKVARAASLLRLEPYLQRTPLELSGGQQQRTAIARALVKGADLVLLDEPLANLDYKLREELRAELPRIFSESGAVFVYATTEPSEALLLGGNTATLHEGRVTQYGRTVDVYRQPHDRITAEVFSDPPMNFVDLELDGSHAHLPNGQHVPQVGTLQGLAAGSYVVGFRPNHVAVNNRPGLVPLAAKTAVSEITGSESFIHVDVGGFRWIALEAGVYELNPGTDLTIYLDPARFFVFDGNGRLVRAPQSEGGR